MLEAVKEEVVKRRNSFGCLQFSESVYAACALFAGLVLAAFDSPRGSYLPRSAQKNFMCPHNAAPA